MAGVSWSTHKYDQLGVLASCGDGVPAELVQQVEGISLYGVDPEWQLNTLGQILDRWARRQ